MEKIHSKLSAIQSALKAPKSQYNEFGRYKYRKAEDILEAVKPLLSANGCALTCTDELILVGDRYYIKATAIITCTEDGSSVQTTAFAREEAEKKGMDGSQVTGASSSYARKYALNGLLCIDDTADSDTTNVGETKPEKNTGRKPVQKVAEPNPAPEKYLIVADHQPSEFKKNLAAGTDLQLSGHTHAGQLFPLGPLYRLIGYCHGDYTEGEAVMNVSAGACGWRVPFRTQARCNYEVIRLTPGVAG